MTPCVLLRHDEPGGEWHFDWLMARWPEEDRDNPGPLICYRVHVRPDEPGIFEFKGERLADHRSSYLRYEGALSDGRGSVRRVATGWCIIDDEEPDRLIVHVVFGGAARRLIGTRDRESIKSAPLGEWRFVAVDVSGGRTDGGSR